MDRFLIDECLTGELVAVAKARGYSAAYVPHIGKGGWQDWNLVPFAVENDYIIVTVNRRDFLKQHAKFDVHPGLVILIPSLWWLYRLVLQGRLDQEYEPIDQRFRP